MHDGGKIIIGLLVFLILVTAPLWYNLGSGQAGNVPELERASRGEQCVRDSTWMTAHHMNLLNEWRDEVVRHGDRFETGPDGAKYEKSLTNTCLGCHRSKERFCDRCHNYLSVDPYCWECHIIPEEPRQ
jgi:hypothetical protein